MSNLEGESISINEIRAGSHVHYEVHITRKANWRDAEGPAISLSEWLAYVRSDPEMQLCYACIRGADGETRLIVVDVAKWAAHPRQHECENAGWLGHFRDRIFTRDPDKAMLEKMRLIARALNAKVQGDEGEEYDANGESLER